jgi:LysM repeat protein/lysophospholipase L1-like esterase
LRKILFFLLLVYTAFGQTDSTVVCLSCNQIIEDQAFSHLRDTWEKRPIKIVQLGDSHIQIGHFSSQFRELLNSIGKLKGTGITFPYSLAKSVDGALYKSKASGHWIGDNILSTKPRLELGVTGYSVKTLDSSASISFQLKNPQLDFSEIKIWFNATDSLSYHPDLGSDFYWKETVKGESKLGYARFVRKNRNSTILLKLIKQDSLANEFQFHGLEFVTSNSGVEYHSLGVVGAQFTHLIQHTKLWKEQLKLLDPDLVIFSYGTNEAYNGNFDTNTYTKQVNRFFDELRSLMPSVAILVTSPPDTRSRNRIPQKQIEIIEAQSKLKSSFYDLNKVMGGFGSFQPWFEKNLFLKDKLHLNKDGYQLQAKLFMIPFLNQLKSTVDLSDLKSEMETSVKSINRRPVSKESIVKDSIVKDSIESVAIVPKKKVVQKEVYHLVKKGDTFYSIAARYHVKVNSLIEKNRRVKSTAIQLGDRIRIK